jgi:hypothetical protein
MISSGWTGENVRVSECEWMSAGNHLLGAGVCTMEDEQVAADRLEVFVEAPWESCHKFKKSYCRFQQAEN